MRENFTWKRAVFALAAFAALILFDQWTKALAVANLMNQEPFVLIDGVFQLRYLENRGAAFGMMQGQQTFFIISASLAVLAIIYVYFKLPWEKRFHGLRTVVLFIAAGAFHLSKITDLIPELQGRFPLHVELSALGEKELRDILVRTDNALIHQSR